MSLQYGDSPDKPEEMTLAVYTEMDNQLSPPLKEAIKEAKEDFEKKAAEKALEDARESWKKLAFAIARGVVEYIKSDMEIYGIETKGEINAKVNGYTERTNPGNHRHDVDLSVEPNSVELMQSNDGTGHVR